MGLNVGVSLWVASPDAPTPAPRETRPAGQTFAQRVGVQPLSAKAGQQLPAAGDVQAHEAGLLGMQRLLQSTAKTPQTGLLELYGLGLRAGQHLSYVPQSFDAAVEGEWLAPAPAADGRVDQAYGPFAVQQPLPGAVSESSVDRVVMPQANETMANGDDELPSLSPLLSYLMRKWPERHVQILPRGKGIEVIIRDYYLGPDEQRALVRDLAHQAVRPETLWINGQPVWQARSFSNQSTGEPHGH